MDPDYQCPQTLIKEKLKVQHPPEQRPEDWASFFETKTFTRAWARLGLSDIDRQALKIAIMACPNGPIVKGTGGLRKLRFAGGNFGRGKRGGARVCYVYWSKYAAVLLMKVYTKNEKDDLSQAERNEIKKVIKEIEDDLEKGPVNV